MCFIPLPNVADRSELCVFFDDASKHTLKKKQSLWQMMLWKLDG